MDKFDENKETPISHSEQIKAKLNRWKSHSKIETKNTIDQFLIEKIEIVDNYKKNNTENFQETQISTSSITLIESNEVNDKEEKIFELKQNILDDDKETEIFMDTSYNKNNELSKNNLINSNNKNSLKCKPLENESEKSDEEENYSLDLRNKMDMSSKDQHLYVQDTDENLLKMETDVTIEIDSSIAPKDRKYAVVETNLEQIRQRLKNLTRITEKQKIKTRFYATIDPSKNQQAEIELCREISKDMFSRVS